MLTTLLALVIAACPTFDLLTLPSPSLVHGPTLPDFEVELASKRMAVVPGTVVGPYDLGVDGALVAAVRCGGGACEVVVAHLAPVGSLLELSGLVGAFPARDKAAKVLGVAAKDLVGGGEREVVVRWQTASGVLAGVLRWDGFTRVWEARRAQCQVRVAVDARECPRPMIHEDACGDARDYRWDDARALFVRVRR